MPARRKPAQILELRGAFKANPERRRPPEVAGNGDLGDPPKRFNALERRIWRDLKAQLPPGIATGSDRVAFECLCILVRQVREGGNVKMGTYSLLRLYFKDFGLTPTGRLALPIAKKPGCNRFSEFGENPYRDS
jgi:hypothetical protein